MEIFRIKFWFRSTLTRVDQHLHLCRPPQELDPVTLHNQALMNMDSRPSEGFEKLSFLMQQPPFPPVCFGNLLLLYCKHEVRRPT